MNKVLFAGEGFKTKNRGVFLGNPLIFNYLGRSDPKTFYTGERGSG
jgi:hypothetical protein